MEGAVRDNAKNGLLKAAYEIVKAGGYYLKPWSLLLSTSQTGGVVRTRGLEPPRLSAPDPKSGVSAIPPRAQLLFYKHLQRWIALSGVQ